MLPTSESAVPEVPEVPEIPAVLLNWTHQYRIIPSKFPPIHFFEGLVTTDQMEAAFYIESLTNDRLREEAGDISRVQPMDRISGKGSSIVMAAFTHIGKPSRFTNGNFGVYYAAKKLNTAIIETVYWREKFLSYTNENPGSIDMRVYVGKVLKSMQDIRAEKYQMLHHPEDYSHSQSFAAALREQGSYGIVYNSVRDKGGECIAALRPTAISIPMQRDHLAYVWDGNNITKVYDQQSRLLFKISK